MKAGEKRAWEFTTDLESVKRALEESSKTIEQRVMEIESAKYATQDMLRREITI